MDQQHSQTVSTPPAFHVMLKPRGAICNLDCHYCFYLKKEALYPAGSFRMSDELLESYTRQYIAAQRVPEVTFAWQGGEPTLMGLDFFRKAVEFQQKYRRPGMRVHNNFQTNGTLLNEEWCRFFHENDFLIGLSLDGPQDLHDAYRVDKGNRPTFERVLAAARLMQQYQVEFNVLTCVNNLNARKPLEVYRFLRDEVGTKFIQFIPIVEPEPQSNRLVSSRSVSGKDYGYFLSTIFDEWVRQDVGTVFVQIFDVSLAAWSGSRPGLCIFDETCGTAMAMEHNGDLYACDHFVDQPHYLGNIQETPLASLAGDPRQLKFGQDKKSALPRTCRECPVRFVCNGGCPKDRLLTTSDGEPGLNFLCAGYKAFFTHIDEPMKAMSEFLRQQRPPAEIMSSMPPLGRKRHR
jgi:uncharacterized protein